MKKKVLTKAERLVQEQKTWMQIASEAELPTPVLLRLTGLIGYRQ